MMWFYLMFFLIQLIGYPLIGVRLIKSIFKKDKLQIKKNTIRLLILMIFSGLVFEKLPGSNLFYWPFEAVDSKFYTHSLTNKSFIFKDPVFEWNSERAFNGDGTSIAIYPLTEKISTYFSNPDSTFFTQYPKKGIRNDWEVVNWSRTPIHPEHKDAFNFSIYGIDNTSNYNLDELLRKQGNYYSFLFYNHSAVEHETYYGNVDFYILCPKERILVTINHNT